MSDRAWRTRRSRLVGAVAAWTGALDDGADGDGSPRDGGRAGGDVGDGE